MTQLQPRPTHTRRLARLGLVLTVLAALHTLPATARDAHAEYPANLKAAGPAPAQLDAPAPPPAADTAPPPPALAAPAAADAQTFSVSVRMAHGKDASMSMAEKPVILLAARPKGPFEQADPAPVHQWTALTDEAGRATFTDLPLNVVTQGLRLHAATTYGGVVFKSAQVVPAPGITLDLKVYEQAHDLSGVVIKELQSIAHIWENHVFFQQFYLFGVQGDHVIDTAQLPGEEFRHGLPIQLPTTALGIHIQAPGETRVINSFAYWKGLLKPGETVPVSITFSKRADSTTFVYEQTVDYPVESAKIVVPLESNSPQIKIPYFDTVSLSAPDFKVEAVQGGIGGQNTGMFLVADERALKAGESFAFQLTGLPFDEPTGAWLALIFGILGAAGVIVWARREQQLVDKSRRSGEVSRMLEVEHEELLDELAMLEQDYQDGEVGDLEYERESLLLRGRIALVMKRLEELRAENAPQPGAAAETAA